jgi:ABC-type uncharacterized transport system substrate-binding protein
MGPWHKIVEETGGPNDGDDGLNKQAFEAGFRDAGTTEPDLIVTIGTQVSVYAARHYQAYPRYFLAVTDPVASGLVKANEIKFRDRNVAGFSNGIIPKEMVNTFARCFPHKTFGFLYNEHQLQDMQMKGYLDAQDVITVHYVKLDPGSPAFDRDLHQASDIFFGWNALNKNIDRFVTANPDLAFIGPQFENIEAGVVASYGADFAKLGRESADFLVNRFFAAQQPLSSLEINFPDTARMLVSDRQLQHFGLRLGEHCQATRVP